MVMLVDIANAAMSDRTQRMTHGSTLREIVFEHLVLGAIELELLERGHDFAELHGRADRDGYDVVLEVGSIARHVQLKSTTLGCATREVPVNSRLASKPSGCVIWSVYDPDIRGFSEYRWFGAVPGEPLPDLGDRVARHSRANAKGIKAFRPAIRNVGLARFERLTSIPDLVDRLFGEAL